MKSINSTFSGFETSMLKSPVTTMGMVAFRYRNRLRTRKNFFCLIVVPGNIRIC